MIFLEYLKSSADRYSMISSYKLSQIPCKNSARQFANCFAGFSYVSSLVSLLFYVSFLLHVKAISTLNSHNYDLQWAAFIYFQFFFLYFFLAVCINCDCQLNVVCGFPRTETANLSCLSLCPSVCVCAQQVFSWYLAFISAIGSCTCPVPPCHMLLALPEHR